MENYGRENIVTLKGGLPIWERIFTVNPLVLVGTRERERYDLAPKHMAFPVGWENYFGFVCTPRHRTYHNAKREGVFTVSYPRPAQVVLTSLAAAPREDGSLIKSALDALPTFSASVIDGIFIEDAYLFLECMLDRIIDDLGGNSLLVGRILVAHVQEDYLRVSEKDDHDLIHESPLLAYLNPGRYTSITESYSFPFPVGFMR